MGIRRKLLAVAAACGLLLTIGVTAQPASAAGGDPEGNLDSVGRGPGGIRVSGWALDPDTAAPIDVHVYVDGVGAGIVTANTYRPDVGAAYPGYGNFHGYDAVVAYSAAGNHTVCTYGINTAGPGLRLTSARRVHREMTRGWLSPRSS